MRNSSVQSGTIEAIVRQLSTKLWSPAEAGYARPSRGRLAALSAQSAVRLQVPARSRLFSEGDPARRIYFVEQGRLLVHRNACGQRLVVRRKRAGDLVLYDCDGTHVANALAVVDSVVLGVDRQLLAREAAHDPMLRDELTTMHARELAMILESLAQPDTRPQQGEPRTASVEPPRAARSDEHHGSAGAVVLPFPLRGRAHEFPKPHPLPSASG